LRKEKIIARLMILIMVISLFQPIKVYAEDDILHKSYAEYRDDYMIQEILNDGIDPNVNGRKSIYTIDLTYASSKGIMTMYGEHKKSQSTIRYKTEGYNFTVKTTGGNVTKYSTANEERIFVKPQKVDDEYDKDIVRTTYELPFWQVSKAAIRMHVAEEMKKGKTQAQAEKIITDKLNSDGIIVYFSHVFAVYNDQTMIKGPYANLKEIQNAVDWSEKTKKDILPAYYDIPLKITQRMMPSGTYSIQIVDMTDNQTKKFTYNDATSGKYDINYTMPSSTKNIAILDKGIVSYDADNLITDSKGQQYKFFGKAFYNYESSPTASNATTVIDNKVTYTNEGTGNALLLLGYVRAGDECNVKVKYFHESDSGVTTLIGTENAGTIKAKTAFSFANYVKSTYNYKNKTYTYKNKWDYVYYNEKAVMQKVDGEKGKTKITIDSLLKGSEVVINMYYKGDPPIDPPTDIPDQSTDTTIDYTDTTSLKGQIKADNKGAEKFIVEQGIPTTESLYTTVQAPEYLLKAGFSRVSSSKQFQVTVKKDYVLKWYSEVEVPIAGDKDGKTKTVRKDFSETVPTTQYVTITRQFKYTEVTNIDYLKIADATISNYALPGESVKLQPKGYSVPTLTYNHYSGDDSHIKIPDKFKTGIILPAETINGGTVKPTIQMKDFTGEADALLPQLQVRNDVFNFGGQTVMTDNYKEKEAEEAVYSAIKKPSLISDTTLYDDNLVIEATKNNGNFGSKGEISYQSVVSFQGSIKSPKYNVPVNEVVVHTAVYCNPEIVQDNKQYVQLVNPDDSCIPLVLDEKGISSDLTLKISNTGLHSNLQGYGNRDYTRSLRNPNVSYLASINGVLRNEVKFPFDVYLDVGSDNKTSNDKLIKAGTWYTVGTNTHRFYLPMWVKEGIYTIDFRSVAVNGQDKEFYTETIANRSRSNYIATDSVKVQVSGKLYGLTLYDISDDDWKDVFKVPKSKELKVNYLDKYSLGVNQNGLNVNKTYNYTVGTKDEYGRATSRIERYTLPLIPGSHPTFKNVGVQKNGYVLRFKLNTIGDKMSLDNSYVLIEPKFYFIDSKGKNREEVDLYYSVKKNGGTTFVKVGSKTDTDSHIRDYPGNTTLGIPVNELKDTASIRNTTYLEWKGTKANLYTYGRIKTNIAFKTFSNAVYAKDIMTSSNGAEIKKMGITEGFLKQLKQSYYFNYSLPNNTFAVTKDFNLKKYASEVGVKVNDPVKKKGGYIMVNFNITAYDNNGKAYMSYINADNYLNGGYCSMWVKEGSPISKVGGDGVTYNFKAGDVYLWDTDRNIQDDYSSGGIY